MIRELRLPGIAGPRTLQVMYMHPPELLPGTHSYELLVDGEQPGIGGSFITSHTTGRRETAAFLTLTCNENLTITHAKANSTQAAEFQRRILRDQHGRRAYP